MRKRSISMLKRPASVATLKRPSAALKRSAGAAMLEQPSTALKRPWAALGDSTDAVMKRPATEPRPKVSCQASNGGVAKKSQQRPNIQTGHYDALGIPRTASLKDVRKGFLAMARKAHPDHGGSSEKFEAVMQAFTVLSSDEKRSLYDAELTSCKSSDGKDVPAQNATVNDDGSERLGKARIEIEKILLRPGAKIPEDQDLSCSMRDLFRMWNVADIPRWSSSISSLKGLQDCGGLFFARQGIRSPFVQFYVVTGKTKQMDKALQWRAGLLEFRNNLQQRYNDHKSSSDRDLSLITDPEIMKLFQTNPTISLLFIIQKTKTRRGTWQNASCGSGLDWMTAKKIKGSQIPSLKIIQQESGARQIRLKSLMEFLLRDVDANSLAQAMGLDADGIAAATLHLKDMPPHERQRRLEILLAPFPERHTSLMNQASQEPMTAGHLLMSISKEERIQLKQLRELIPCDSGTDDPKWMESKMVVRAYLDLLATVPDESSSMYGLVCKLLEHAEDMLQMSKNGDRAFFFARFGSSCWKALTSTLRQKIMKVALQRPTAFFFDQRCNHHLAEVHGVHESPERMHRAQEAAKKLVQDARCQDGWPQLVLIDLTDDTLNEAQVSELCNLAHTSNYISKQMRKLKIAGQQLQVGETDIGSVRSCDWHRSETKLSNGSLQSVLAAITVVKTGIDNVLNDASSNAFCCVRPPGHHVGRDGRTNDAPSQGFCFFNNVAIGAKYAVDKCGLNRVCVIDFDVHHGNGTQEILAPDSRFRFYSLHAFGSGFYPGSGDTNRSNVVNKPLPLGFGIEDMCIAFGSMRKCIEDFRPQLIIVSAGFDAHAKDPLGNAQLDAQAFATITEQIVNLAWSISSCRGRVVSVLEGGYDVKMNGALYESVYAHLQGFLVARIPSSLVLANLPFGVQSS